MAAERVIIFDTTLRDGEQAPGATMTVEEKIAVASLLDQMGVDVIEAGFAIASDGDFDAIKKISKIVKKSRVCSLARTKKIDIERAGEAIKDCSVGGRIHTFISTSEIHMRDMMRMSKEDVLTATIDSIKLARQYTDDIEWSAQDATRTEQSFLFQAIESAIKAGATTINIPDTVGFITPFEYCDLLRAIRNNVVNIDKAVLSVHCQNDLGLATGNSLCALLAGARQIECTINGIGERAGNTSLEEVVMSIKTRQDVYNFDISHIDTTLITRLSRLVSQVSGFAVQNNKAIVGANAFAHESGIHQDGMLKNPKTYEIMDPKDIGLEKGEIVLGKHSGRHALKARLGQIGLENQIDDVKFEALFVAFKTLCDKKKTVSDSDIMSLINEAGSKSGLIRLVSISVFAGNEAAPYAKIVLDINGETKKIESYGDGPVDSIFKGIRELSGIDFDLELYQVNAITGGTDSIGSTSVRIVKDGRICHGNGQHTDILVASAMAYIEAINKLL